MARKLTDGKVAEIHELKYLPQRDIAQRVGVSVGMVNSVLAQQKRSAAPTRAPAPSAPPPSDDDETPIDARLARTIASLERASRQAETTGDLARIVAAQRAATQALALAARLAPVPTPDPNEDPDMKALAARGEKMLDDLLTSRDDGSDSPAAKFAREIRRIVDEAVREATRSA